MHYSQQPTRVVETSGILSAALTHIVDTSALLSAAHTHIVDASALLSAAHTHIVLGGIPLPSWKLCYLYSLFMFISA